MTTITYCSRCHGETVHTVYWCPFPERGLDSQCLICFKVTQGRYLAAGQAYLAAGQAYLEGES